MSDKGGITPSARDSRHMSSLLLDAAAMILFRALGRVTRRTHEYAYIGIRLPKTNPKSICTFVKRMNHRLREPDLSSPVDSAQATLPACCGNANKSAKTLHHGLALARSKTCKITYRILATKGNMISLIEQTEACELLTRYQYPRGSGKPSKLQASP